MRFREGILGLVSETRAALGHHLGRTGFLVGRFVGSSAPWPASRLLMQTVGQAPVSLYAGRYSLVAALYM